MRRRINCPFHKDGTASLIQYPGSWYCHGACHKQYTNKEAEERKGVTYVYEEGDQQKEDISEEIEYIRSLGKTDLRGFSFPTDLGGYYLVWPDSSYYKYRKFQGEPKYVGPKGHKPPLFWARQTGLRTLAIVEGEINSLSVASVMESWDVVSPGSASMFNGVTLLKLLTLARNYANVVVILDDDAAGSKGLIECKAAFLYKIPFVTYVKLKPDANEILIESGKEALRERLQRVRG